MKKIYIRWDSPRAAHELDRTISKLAKSGQKIFTMAAPQYIRTYPNVCVPLAAMMEQIFLVLYIIFIWFLEEEIKYQLYNRMITRVKTK